MAASNRPVTIEDIIMACASKRAAMNTKQRKEWKSIEVQRGFCLPAEAEAYRQAVETIGTRQLTSLDRLYMTKMCLDSRSQSDKDLLDSLTKSAVESVYADQTFSLNRAVGILLTVSDLVVRAMTSGEEDRVFHLTGWCTDLFNGNLTTYGKAALELSEWLKSWMVERNGLKQLLSEAKQQHDLPPLEHKLNKRLPPDYKPFQIIQKPLTNPPSKRSGPIVETPTAKKPASAASHGCTIIDFQGIPPGSVVNVLIKSQKPAADVSQQNLPTADKAPNAQSPTASSSAAPPVQLKCKCGTDKASNVLKQQTMARCPKVKCGQIWCRINNCKEEFTASLACFTHQESAAHKATHRKLLQTNIHPNILTDTRCSCSGTTVPVFSTGGFMGLCRVCNAFRCLAPNCGKTFPSVNLYATHHVNDHLGCGRAGPSTSPSICGVCGTQRYVVATPAITKQCYVCCTYWCVIGNCNREFANLGKLTIHQTNEHKKELP